MLGEEATCLERPLAGRELGVRPSPAPAAPRRLEGGAGGGFPGLTSCPVQWKEVTLPFCRVAGGLPMSLKGSQPSLWEFSQDAGVTAMCRTYRHHLPLD